MRIELTLKADYVPNWGMWAGLRELLQNAKDAEVEYKAPMSVEYFPKEEKLLIRNKGAALPLEALLIGHTSKADRPELIGQFGEGLKLGILALIRAGCPVAIRTGSQLWLPKLEKSERFNASVMAVYIEDVDKSEDVEVEVLNVSPPTWAQVESRVLWLRPNLNVLDTDSGSLLTDVREAGKIYVKGLYVTTNSKFLVGYNFKNLQLDRDRMMTYDFNAEWEAARVWDKSAQIDPSLAEVAYSLLKQEGSRDLVSLAAIQPNSDIVTRISDLFVAEFGPDVIPVSSEAEVSKVRHYGIRGTVTTVILSKLFHSVKGGLDEHIKKLAAQPTRIYKPEELTAEESGVLNIAIAILTSDEVIDLPVPPIFAADFRDKRTLGLFRTYDILISRSSLSDLPETIATLLHELAHHYGGDGQFEHVRAMETMAGKALAKLWEQQTT